MKNRDIYWGIYKIQETLYIGQWYLSPLQSRHLGTSHGSPNHHQLPYCIFLNLFDGLKSLPFQRWFSFGEKLEVSGHPMWTVAGLSYLGDMMFYPKTLYETWCMSRCTVVTKLPSPVAHSCGFLNNLNSFCRGMFKLNAKLDAALLLYLLSHFECSSHKIYMLTQHCLLSTLSSAVKSSMFTHVHSSPLSLAARLHWCHTNHSHYINNGWSFSRQTSYLLSRVNLGELLAV